MGIQKEYDFQITKIGLIAERLPNPKWHINSLANSDYYIIGFCVDGKATYNINSKTLTVNKGDTLFFPKGYPHSAASDPKAPWHFYTIAFDISFADTWSQDKFLSFLHIPPSLNTYHFPVTMAELNNAWTGKRPGYLIKCRSLLLDILFCIIKEMEYSSFNTPHYQTIEKVANFIQVNHYNNYSVEDLAKLSGLSTSHFRLLFKKITGFTPIQYQNHVRINKARDLLLSGDCNVTEAALTVGYRDVYYFSRLFKKIIGINPSDYLKK